jgi:hypothetical protein
VFEVLRALRKGRGGRCVCGWHVPKTEGRKVIKGRKEGRKERRKEGRNKGCRWKGGLERRKRERFTVP